MNKQETKLTQQTLEPTRLGRFEAGNALNCSENKSQKKFSNENKRM